DSPWDSNWPFGFPPDALPPNQPPPTTGEDPNDQCQQSGSTIDCQGQTLGEAVSVIGTPFQLVYRSDRQPGRQESYRANIPITGPNPPPDLEYVDLLVSVDGLTCEQHYLGP